jgi:hypothetical protein
MAFPTDWGRKCALVIQASKIDSNQVNFPVLLDKTTLPSEMFDGGGAYYALDGGGDVRFSSDSAGNTRLSCEIVTFEVYENPVNGVAEIWVGLPAASASSNTTIYVWYHKAGESQPAADAAYGSESVWDSSFKMVQHMKDTTTSTTTDSTSNDNDGTKTGANEPLEVTGQIGKGQDFDGTNDRISLGTSTTLQPSNLTFSAWVKRTVDWSTTNGEIFYAKDTAWDDNGWYIAIDGSFPRLLTVVDGANCFWYTATINTLFPLNEKVHVVVTFNSTTNAKAIYINGVSKTLVTYGTPDSITGTAVTKYLGFGLGGYFDVTLDETRSSNTDRSSTWISTEYNNQNDPSTFVVEGTPETPDGAESNDHLMIMGM